VVAISSPKRRSMKTSARTTEKRWWKGKGMRVSVVSSPGFL
jgi:hypothetical protein